MFLLINKSKSCILVRAILGRMEEEFGWFNPQAAERHAPLAHSPGVGENRGTWGLRWRRLNGTESENNDNNADDDNSTEDRSERTVPIARGPGQLAQRPELELQVLQPLARLFPK